MISQQTLKGNLVLQDYTTAFTLNQGDKGVPFKIELLENGTSYTLLSTDTVSIEWLKPNGKPFLQDGDIIYGTNYIEIITPEAVAQYSGSGTFNIIISDGDVRKGTIRREYKVVATSMAPGSVSEDVITDAMTELRDLNSTLTSTIQTGNLDNYAKKTYVNKEVELINSSLEDITNTYAKKTEVNELAINKAEKIDLNVTNTQVAKNTTDIATQSARIDSFTSLAEGSTTGDAELIDARTVNGKTYTNAGGAVRAISSGEALVNKSITGLKLNSYVYSVLSKVNSKNLVTNPLMDNSIGSWYFENGANYSNQSIENVKTISIPSGGYTYTIFTDFTVGQKYYISFKYFTSSDSMPVTLKVMAYSNNKFVKNVVDFTTPCKTKANVVDRIIDSFTAEEDIDDYRIVIGNTNTDGIIYASQVIVTTDKDSTKEFFTGIVDEKIYMDDYKIGGTYNSIKLIDDAIELICTASDSGVMAYKTIELDGIDKSISFDIKCTGGTYPVTLNGFFLVYKNGKGTSNPFSITVFEDGTYKMEYNGDLKGASRINCGINSPSQAIVLTLSNFKAEDKKAVYNPLIGKKITANGDSIMQGVGYAGGFAKLIAKRNNMAYENIAIGGGTIAKGTTTSTGANRHWICDTVTNMDSNADYAIFDGGINDFWNYVPIGTLTTDYTTAVDNTTFYGALEYLFRTAYTHFSKNTKILYVVQHNVNDIYYLSQNGQKYSQFHEAILKTCAKYSIPVVDLFENGRFNTYLDKYKALCANSDGVHPNEQGYNLYYVPQIEAKLKNL